MRLPQMLTVGFSACSLAFAGCGDGPPTIPAGKVLTAAFDAPDVPEEVVVVDTGGLPARPNPPMVCEGSPKIAPGFSYGRLLTGDEYRNTVLDILGIDATEDTAFPEENQALGFNNGVAHKPSALLVDLYMKAAEQIAPRTAHEGVLATDTCMTTGHCDLDAKIAEIGARLFRRPMTPDELAVFTSLADAPFIDDKADRLPLVIEAMLQSPQFLFRFETTGVGDDDGVVELDSFALAARLSYLIFDGPPDDELWAVAQADGLRDTDTLRGQAVRMLAHPRAKRMLRDFHAQWLLLTHANDAVKDADRFPAYTPEMRDAWVESVLHLMTEEVFDADDAVQTMFNTDHVYVDETLSALYGASITGDNFLPTTGSADGGLLTQPGLMALLAYPDQGSPIRRGVFVREKILCEHLPQPPPDLEIVPPDPDPSATTRERFAAHTESEPCASCHVQIDPVGFAFENYDALGRYRTTENGAAIDASGEIFYPYMMEEVLLGPLNGAAEMAHRLGQSEQVKQCIGTQWFRYTFGRAETSDDGCNIAPAMSTLAERGDLRGYLLALIQSPAFRYRQSGDTP